MQIGYISQGKSEPKRDQEKLLALSQGSEQWDGPWVPRRVIVTDLQLLLPPLLFCSVAGFLQSRRASGK